MPDDASATTPRRLPFPFAVRPKPERDELLYGPIRGELLGTDQLGEKARDLADKQRLSSRRRVRRETPLLVRLTATRDILHDGYARLASCAGRDVDVEPASEWLLDNFHVVREHIHEVLMRPRPTRPEPPGHTLLPVGA